MTNAFRAPAGASDLPLEDIPEVLTQDVVPVAALPDRGFISYEPKI